MCIRDRHNIKANIGVEAVYETGRTFSINYERLQKLDNSAHYDNIYFKFGHISEKDSEFALNYNPLQNNQTDATYTKIINGYNVMIGSNYSLDSDIPNYGANIEVSSTF